MAWWIWSLIGLGLILSELFLPAFVLIWFGLSALVIAGLVALMADMTLTVQLLLWSILSLALMGLWFRVFRRGVHKSFIGRASANIIGEVGMIIEPVAPFRQGKVRFQKPIVGSDTWACVSNEELPISTRVKVDSIDGSLLTVSKTGE